MRQLRKRGEAEREFYTINEFRDVYRHGRTTIYKLIEAGEIEAVKVG